MNKNIKAGADIHAGDGGYSIGTQEKYDEFVKVRNKSLAQGRIKELAEQAGWDYSKIERRNQTENFDEQKFAELIVRECAKIADIADENKCEWIGGNILTHFGVEE